MSPKIQTEAKKKKCSDCQQESYDIYGTDIAPFRHNGSDKFNTKYGFFVSILLSILMILAIIYYASNFLERDTNPDFQISSYHDSMNLEGDLASSANNVQIALLFQDTKTDDFITFGEISKSFNIKASGVNIKKHINANGVLVRATTRTTVTTDLCRDSVINAVGQIMESFNDKLQSYFSDYLTCFEYDTLPIGDDVLVNQKGMHIQAQPCTGSLCTNLLPIERIRLYIAVYYPVLDIENRYSPIKMSLDYSNEFTFDSKYQKQIKMLLKEINITTESGQLIPETWETKAIGFDRFQVNDVVKTESLDAGSYFTINIVSTDQKVNVSRSYETLTDFLSNIGGFGEIIGWLSFLMYSWYNTYFFDKYLMLKGIPLQDEYYPERYQLKKDYDRQKCCLCNLSRCRKKKTEAEQKILEEKRITIEVCEKIIDQRLDLVNFIKDSMDFQIIRRLLLKDRHQALVPLLMISLAYNADNEKPAEQKVEEQEVEKVQEGGPNKEPYQTKTGNAFVEQDKVSGKYFEEKVSESKIPQEYIPNKNEKENIVRSLFKSKLTRDDSMVSKRQKHAECSGVYTKINPEREQFIPYKRVRDIAKIISTV